MKGIEQNFYFDIRDNDGCIKLGPFRMSWGSRIEKPWETADEAFTIFAYEGRGGVEHAIVFGCIDHPCHGIWLERYEQGEIVFGRPLTMINYKPRYDQ